MARISRTGTTDSTGVASTTVTGSGGGRLKFISRNGNLWSNSYEIEDYLFYDDGITSTSNGFIFNTTDIQLNVDTVGKTGTTVSNVSSTTGRTYWANKKGTPPTVDLDWASPIAVECDILNGSNSVAFQFGRQADSQIVSRTLTQLGLTNGGHLKFTFDGTNARYFVNNSNTPLFTVPLQISDLSVIRFYCPASTNFKYKNFMIYPIFSAPKHYTPIALSSSASIIQTGESATLSAELTNVLGEKLASKSVNFIEKVEHLYENTSEVSQVYNSGQNVTVLSPSISRTDLGTSWTLSFDMKSDCESRVFIGNSASAIPTNPQYSIFMGRDTSNVISYGFRTTTTTVTASNVASTSYHACKIVFNNGTITYYVDDTQVGTKTVSFYGNYDNYVVGLVAWGTGTLYAKNIVLDNGSGGDILIGTGTSNSQGIATCNNTITGTGKGERQFIASNSSILSETYTIMDTHEKKQTP